MGRGQSAEQSSEQNYKLDPARATACGSIAPDHAPAPDGSSSPRALSTDAARKIWESLSQLLNEAQDGLNPMVFRSIIPLDASGAAAGIREWFLDFLPQSEETLFLCSSEEHVEAISTSMFFDRWESYCLSGNGNLAIWPEQDHWLAFFHGERRHLLVGNRIADKAAK